MLVGNLQNTVEKMWEKNCKCNLKLNWILVFVIFVIDENKNVSVKMITAGFTVRK